MRKAPFNPANWYWYVAGDRTQAFSSAAASYVPLADATFQAWLARGFTPTSIESEASLWDVLSQAHPAGLPAANAAAQDQYKQAQIAGVSRAVFQVLFNHKNRIRMLEGRAVVTAPQFIAGIKSLL